MNKVVLTNNPKENIGVYLHHFATTSTKIEVVSAFYSDLTAIKQWQANGIEISLLVSLRPPTNYHALKSINHLSNVTIRFLGNELHSKFFLFYQGDRVIKAVIGSSNFTPGGLQNNIETNIITDNDEILNGLKQDFLGLWNQSYLLQPSDLDEYKKVFDSFQEKQQRLNAEQQKMNNKLLSNRSSRIKKVNVGKEAKQYFEFWKIVDEIKKLVSDISKLEYPDIPVYITIDHFWHWIKTEWSKSGRKAPTHQNRQTEIPKLFKEYCKWDKSTDNHTTHMGKISRTFFSKVLSERNISSLTIGDAEKVYSNLHSGAMRSRRFGADKLFATQNSIKQIRESLSYLLHSNEELDLRIHQLCDDKSPYKLKQLKSSGAQELIGWVNPEKFPMRNDKAMKR